jgi:hypothetical protein
MRHYNTAGWTHLRSRSAELAYHQREVDVIGQLEEVGHPAQGRDRLRIGVVVRSDVVDHKTHLRVRVNVILGQVDHSKQAEVVGIRRTPSAAGNYGLVPILIKFSSSVDQKKSSASFDNRGVVFCEASVESECRAIRRDQWTIVSARMAIRMLSSS